MTAKQWEQNQDGTRRGLSNLAVQMIAFGGAIGTGLFLGAGSTIHKTGPSILAVYLLMGLFFFFMMRAIGEMMYSDPNQHTFVSFIGKYLGPRLGYFAAWSYWIELILAAMAELTALSTYVAYWLPNFPAWLVQVLFLAVLTLVNLAMVRAFGHAETLLSGIKILAIVILMAVGIFLIMTHHRNLMGTHATLSNLSHHFVLFPNGTHAFINAFPMVFFAFQGMEFVGITTAETKKPLEVLPRAVNQIIVRILFFYIGSLVVIMAITPWRSLSQSQSPFVQVFQMAGFSQASQLINLVVIAAASSTLNSAIFSTGRHLYQLAQETPGHALRVFEKVSRRGIPYASVLFSAGMMLLAPVISSFSTLSSAFTFIAAISSDIYILVCLLTMMAHWQYRQSPDFLANGFKMPAYHWTNPLTIALFLFIFMTLFFNAETRLPAAGALFWLVGFNLFLAWHHQWQLKKKPVTLKNQS